MNTYEEKYASNFMADEPEQIQEKTQSLAKTLAETLSEANFTKVSRLLQEIKPMSYSIQGYLEELQLDIRTKDTLMHAGYNSALLDIMRLYAANLHALAEIKKITTKYRDDVLRILDKRGTLLHKDLAAELMITANNLTAVIKQMNATSVKLIHIEEFSKFKAYSLTPIARKYIDQYMPDTPVDQEPKQKDADYRIVQKDITVSVNSHFDEPDIQNKIVLFVKDASNRYNKKDFASFRNERSPQQNSSRKFAPAPSTYGIKKKA